MNDEVIRIEHLYKLYRLGAIGGATLRSDLQSLTARIFGRDDPNLKIGSESYTGNAQFYALSDVNLSVNRGERVGVIGYNGAGKSTLLKLLSRVTAPSSGKITYKGRVASMLEVGTGFHQELTGRENIYLNGAILGMKKAEIAAKFDEIVAFSELEQFIDTPVKRYSSGMYVRLAFAVIANLVAEIMIMDEVLAVGDVKFQQKCLSKMEEVSKTENRTILYVSHNMSTIHQFCNRCVMLDKGKVAYDGDVQTAIRRYTNADSEFHSGMSLENIERDSYLPIPTPCVMLFTEIISHKDGIVRHGEKLRIKLIWRNRVDAQVCLRVEYIAAGRCVAASITKQPIECKAGQIKEKLLELDLSGLVAGTYDTIFTLYEPRYGVSCDLDCVRAINFELIADSSAALQWNTNQWSYVKLADIEVE